jgi:hypothetical protein
MPEQEFAFDVKLWAVARVKAGSQAEARKKLTDVVDCIDIGFDQNGVKLTEASAEGSYDLIETDGEAV